ncbi:P-loop containing nucleoside triphosphate hydrolase protein, partial [Cristinia sonorae]
MADAALEYWPPAPPHDETGLTPVSDIVPHPSRLAMLRKFLHKPDASFSCPMQGALIEHVIAGKRNILAVLPTGSGKTDTLLMLADTDGSTRVLVMILPLNALHADVHARARQYGLQVAKFSRSNKFNRNAQIVTVAIESVEHPQFHAYLQELKVSGRLYRIVFDEIHMVITEKSYRPAFSQALRLCLHGTQIIGLSATLPPHLVQPLTDITHIKWHVLRMPSNRKELRFGVKTAPSRKVLLRGVCAYISWALKSSEGSKKLVVALCDTIDTADRLAEKLQVMSLHSRTGLEALEAIRAGKQRVLVATSAAEAGLDLPMVTWVLRVGAPYNMISDAQGSGRGGRGGVPCRVITFSLVNPPPRTSDCEYDIGQTAVLDNLKTKECLRLGPSKFLDGVAVTC